MSLDMKTIFFNYIASDLVCTVFMVFLWYRNRKRFAGMSLWVVHFVLQVTGLMLIVMRDTVPDFFSIVVANSLMVGGAFSVFVGLERFVGKQGRQVHNFAFLAAFVFAHTYFTYVQPSLAARIMNLSLGLLVLASQCAWLLFRRVDSIMRPITRGTGMVFGAYCGVSLLRMILILVGPPSERSFLQSGTVETLLIVIYQMLFIIQTYSLAIMVNRRLTGEIQSQEERFRSMVEFSSDWDYWIGPDGSLLYSTPSCEGVTGYGPQKFIDDPELRKKIVHPDDQAAVRDHSDNPPSTVAPLSLDCRILTRDGETRWLNHVCRPVFSSDGRCLGRVASNRDITDRKQIEQQLVEARENWERIFHAIGHFTLILSPTQELLAVNRMGERLLGRPAHELIGKRCYEVFHGTSAPPTGCPFLAMSRDGEMTTAAIEVEILNRIFIVSCTPVLKEDGTLDKVIHVATDITRQKNPEKALRESEEKYRTLVETANDLICIFQDGLIKFHSRRAEELLEYTSEELIDAPFAQFIHPEDRDMVGERHIRRSRGETFISAYPYRVVNKSGGVIWVEGNSALTTWEGKPAVLSYLRDITERKRLEAQLIQAQRLESVGRLAGGVAHDFNNKLTTILGYTELAMEKLKTSDPLYGDLQEVREAGRQSAKIVQQLLAFARKQIIRSKPMRLNDTVKRMLKMLRRIIGEDIDLKWNPAADLWLVKMDSSQIDQILANLFVNARDAIAGAGEVIVETRNVVLDETFCESHAGAVPGEYVMLAVSDNGYGMDKETLDNVFEPFFTTKEVGKGTGLGLSTVYGIVKQNDGFVYVYSEPGKGTSVKIYLPRHREEGEKGVEAAEAAVLQGRGETILLVEDEASVLQLAQTILEKLGYTVMSSDSPAEALNMARDCEGDIQLLMTDVVLPEMTGKDLAEQLHGLYPDIKVLFMSGYTADAIANHGILDERVHFVQKPFTIRDLSIKVREALDIDESIL